MNNILSVENLCLWYGSHQALKDINIEIPEKALRRSSARVAAASRHF